MNTSPNILFLQAEDTGRHQGCYGDPVGHTPTIDQLAAGGLRFTHAFSTAPVCAPSRGAMNCSKIAFSIGNHHMRSRLLKPPRLLTENLRAAGYYVNWANKTDFNYDPPKSFADDRHDWFEDLASGKLSDKPWFLYHNFGITHESGMWEDKWLNNTRPNLSDDELCDPATVPVPAYLPDTPEVRADIARYYDTLRVQDKQVARALEALDKSGQRDNTVIIYLSDHGRGIIREKRWPYDAGIHLPLIIQAPGLTEPGTVSNELVSWLDIAPTILSLCGAEQLDDPQGRIFLGPEKQPEPEYVFAGRDRMGPVFDRIRVSRSKQFIYLRNDFPELPYAAHSSYMETQQSTGSAREEHASGRLNEAQSLWFTETKPAEELYDCNADPDNVRNLAGDPAYAETLAAHRNALSAFLEHVGDLGLRTEKNLVSKGLIADSLTEYYAQRRTLPERYRIGAELAPVNMPPE